MKTPKRTSRKIPTKIILVEEIRVIPYNPIYSNKASLVYCAFCDKIVKSKIYNILHGWACSKKRNGFNITGGK